jgi:AcrR family transcriptional regulator
MAGSSHAQTSARRRMAPDDRRAEILLAARRLFAEQPYTAYSTADVAAAAGVTRSLVHHYFGGIRAVFVAVVAELAPALADVRTAGPETPIEQRIASNIAAALDVVDANRETWSAVAGHGMAKSDPDLGPLVRAADERSVERILAANADVLRDTPQTRFALRCFNAFSGEATRAWIDGEVDRDTAELLLVQAGLTMLRDVVPQLPDTR